MTNNNRNMETIHKPQYLVEIDFDDASAQWRANKRRFANGCYKYVCIGITKTGKQCSKSPYGYENYCKIHLEGFGK